MIPSTHLAGLAMAGQFRQAERARPMALWPHPAGHGAMRVCRGEF